MKNLLFDQRLPKTLACVSDTLSLGSFQPIREVDLEGNTGLVYDFGEELVGVYEIGLTMSGEARLECIPGEDLEEALLLEDPLPAENWYHQPHDHHCLLPGRQTLRSGSRRAFRFLHLRIHGRGTILIHHVKATLQHAAVEERGFFTSSDPLLTQTWEISCRTTRLCMQEFFEDGVKRDGMLWIGDYRVQFLCAYSLFGDISLARTSLRMISQCQWPDGSLSAAAIRAGGHQGDRLPYMCDFGKEGKLEQWVLDNYCADFICGVYEYALHSGDLSLVVELEPVWRKVLRYLAGIKVKEREPHRHFITDNQPEMTQSWWGSHAALGWQLAAAFDAGENLAHWIADTTLAISCRQWREQSVRQIAALGNPAEGMLRDGWNTGSTRSWHAHAAAFLAGGITEAEMCRIHPVLGVEPSVRRPMAGFMEYYLLRAWFQAGLTNEALEEVRSYYGQMLHSGATTTWELVDRRVKGIDYIQPAGRSHCHGWSAGPAHLLPAYLLGLQPVTPGYATAVWRPSLGNLSWAKGRIPTPYGDVVIELNGQTSGCIELPDEMKVICISTAGKRRLVTGRGIHQMEL